MKRGWKITMTIAVLALVFFVLLWINGATASCENSDTYVNETDICYYRADSKIDCRSNEEFDGKYCTYTPRGFMSNTLLIWVIVVLFLFAILLVIFYYFNKGTEKQKTLQFTKKVDLDPDIAIDTIKKRWVLEHKIHHWEDRIGFHIKKDVFSVRTQEPFIKPNGEHFLQFEMEVMEGDWIGIFTIVVSLNQEVNEILKGKKLRIHKCTFDDYKESPSKRPLYQVEDKGERMAEMLVSQGRTEEAQKIMLQSPQMQDMVSPEEMEEQREFEKQQNDKRRSENRTSNYMDRRKKR